MNKLYMFPITIYAELPFGYTPSWFVKPSIEICGSTLAYPSIEPNQNSLLFFDVIIKGWIVLSTDMNERGIELFMKTHSATLTHHDVKAEITNLNIVFTHDQMLIVDLEQMTLDRQTITFYGSAEQWKI